jgi:heterodisulfide reductase subunit A
MDIPESVFTASGAGAQCGQRLDYRRGKLTRSRKESIPGKGCLPGGTPNRRFCVPLRGQYRKRGGCARHRRICLTLPNVVHAQEQLFSCATNSAKEITDMAKEKGLNRVVVPPAAPGPWNRCSGTPSGKRGINQYYCDMANIREHCSWCHSKEKEEATQKAKDITRMSVARTALWSRLQEFDLPVDKAALVVGGGIAGMTCALSIANQGHEVHLVEKAADLGGGWQEEFITPWTGWMFRPI